MKTIIRLLFVGLVPTIVLLAGCASDGSHEVISPNPQTRNQFHEHTPHYQSAHPNAHAEQHFTEASEAGAVEGNAPVKVETKSAADGMDGAQAE